MAAQGSVAQGLAVLDRLDAAQRSPVAPD